MMKCITKLVYKWYSNTPPVLFHLSKKVRQNVSVLTYTYYDNSSWWKGDEEVTSTDILRVSHAANCAKLMFIPAKRALSGKYTLKAKNKHGEDSAELQIDVVGKPTIPTGPLQVGAFER